jgi:SAM-dependent methyltransferase
LVLAVCDEIVVLEPPNMSHSAGFADHFSGHASNYRSDRPTYPDAIFAFVASLAPATRRAWDCGCGNGQASVGLARHFNEVHATDASSAQVEQGLTHPAVTYRTAPAGASGLPDASTDAVIAAQAVHWFDLDAFYREATRVLVPGGVLAVWCYAIHEINPAIDAIMNRMYKEIVGPFWPKETAYVKVHYTTLPFPFPSIETPQFVMQAHWDLAQAYRYMDTWSAVKAYEAAHGTHPFPLIESDLAVAWGPPETVHEVRWPLWLKVGRKPN